MPWTIKGIQFPVIRFRLSKLVFASASLDYDEEAQPISCGGSGDFTSVLPGR
jgi:hypothetical protein